MDFKQKLQQWANDPVLFVREAFGANPSQWQAEALQALVTEDFLAVRSGHGVGKSAYLSWVIFWFLSTRIPAKIPCTAPTGHQLSDVLWAELGIWLNMMEEPLRSQYSLNTERLSLRGYENSSFAVARTARKENPDAFQGFHCLADDHEILTRRGWMGIDDILDSDEVLSVKDGISSWQPVTAIHKYPYVGELNAFDGRTMSFAVTDGHRFPTRPLLAQDKPFSLVEFCNMPENNAMQRISRYMGEEIEVPEPFAEKGMDAKRFAAFVGFWIGDGGVRQHSTGRFYEVLLYQTKPDVCRWIEDYLLDGIRWSRLRDGYSVSSRAMCDWLIENVGRYGADRRIPPFLKDANQEVLDALCEGLWLSEGSYENGLRRGFYNNSLGLIDDVQEVMIKLGNPGTVGVNRAAGYKSKYPDGREVVTVDATYVISWIKNPTDSRLLKKHVKKVNYAGRVWCISTPYETFYTRRNGRVMVSGNSRNLLFICDEASGIDDKIFEVGEGAMSTPGAKTVMTGNPTKTSGYFYDAFHKMSDFWWTKKVSCIEVEAEYVNQGYADRVAAKWGADSNVYRVRVLGEFPSENDDAVIPYYLVEDAAHRDVEPVTNVMPVWGLDVARFGSDKTALCKRRGNSIMEPIKTWRKRDTMEVAGLILNEYEDTNSDELPSEILVDVIGIGAGVVDRLRELGLPVRGVNVGEAPSGRARYMRLRDELWFRAREWFERRDVSIPDDEELIGQLTTVGWTPTSTGKIKVWSKDEMKDKGMDSPDLADSFCLTMCGLDKRGVMTRYERPMRRHRARCPSWYVR